MISERYNHRVRRGDGEGWWGSLGGGDEEYTCMCGGGSEGYMEE